ncbi:MAG: hypothetical protein ACXABK_00995 [Candidatus Heimdallarchaeaceae archaeon]|jgi:archaellum biogenesis protein FlaJ (TadC family)
MKDKIVGLFMLLSSIGVIVFMFVWTILLPIIYKEEFLFEAYLAIAIVIFIALFILMLLTGWIGWNFMKTRAPKEGVLEEEIPKEV